jgi:hypothetical protein
LQQVYRFPRERRNRDAAYGLDYKQTVSKYATDPKSPRNLRLPRGRFSTAPAQCGAGAFHEVLIGKPQKAHPYRRIAVGQ